MKTPLRYAGGKTKAIKQISPFLEPYDLIVSPFIGGGSLEVHMASLNKEVIGYDVFGTLVNYWDVLINNPIGLANKLSTINPTKEEYERIKEILLCWGETQNMLSTWKTDYYHRDNQIELDNITAAAYYYFNHNCSYGPGYLGWASSVYLNEKKWDKMIDNIRHFNLQNINVFQSDFSDVLLNHNDDFLYLDPPYYLEQDKDNKMFAGIYPTRNIPIHHNSFNHQRLRDLLMEHNGDFVMSYNDCETIREWYKDFELFYPKWNYSMGNGEIRIGKNRKDNNTNVKESHEILIVKRS
jgi:DNA adenine methylase